MTDRDRIERAIDLAVRYGGIDGDRHKAWVIDQMVRELTGCPRVPKTKLDAHDKPYAFEVLGESEEYRRLVREACDGEDGPETYAWDVGIPP